MKNQTIEVPIKLDVESLAQLRLLLSQLGFAIDNYLASQASASAPKGNDPLVTHVHDSPLDQLEAAEKERADLSLRLTDDWLDEINDRLIAHAQDLIAVARAAQDFTWLSVHDKRERDYSEGRMMDALAPLLTTEGSDA